MHKSGMWGAAWLCLAVSGCCGGGPSQTCTAAMDYNGSKHASKGTGSTKEAAEREAVAGVCIAYCQNGDPTVDAEWKKWKATADGKRSTMGKGDEIFLKPELKRLAKACESRCDGEVAAKRIKVTTTCEK